MEDKYEDFIEKILEESLIWQFKWGISIIFCFVIFMFSLCVIIEYPDVRAEKISFQELDMNISNILLENNMDSLEFDELLIAEIKLENPAFNQLEETNETQIYLLNKKTNQLYSYPIKIELIIPDKENNSIFFLVMSFSKTVDYQDIDFEQEGEISIHTGTKKSLYAKLCQIWN